MSEDAVPVAYEEGDEKIIEEKPTMAASTVEALYEKTPDADVAPASVQERENGENDVASSTPAELQNENKYPSMTTKVLVGIGLALAVFLVITIYPIQMLTL
jgi:hypothetical protein